jgi:hypothetical protein
MIYVLGYNYRYSGVNCEVASSTMKAIKTTISITTVLAILSIVAFYSCFVILDVLDIFCNKKRNVRNKAKPVVQKFVYKPSASRNDVKRFIKRGERRELL